MGRNRLKKMHKGDKPLKEKYRTKRRTKDLDLIHNDMKSPDSLLKQEVDLDKPGAAQFYCLTCAKYFINQKALTDHFKSKPHKRRLKALEVEPYTHEEAERAAGMGSYIAPKKVEVLAQDKLAPEDREGDTTMKPA
ncbi:Zinc finger protein 593-like [Plakobranchus ocellatus]|uniref:Zinc finger protein 593-like n=1 Tax=Plakobranchus ocellatus TaxID=259542 RepID=A0AAV4DYH8_9GAST|nr:Zinc finger protein 593-like [Plakobranchus ocellatus]